jgi:hypothetical protein
MHYLLHRQLQDIKAIPALHTDSRDTTHRTTRLD